MSNYRPGPADRGSIRAGYVYCWVLGARPVRRADHPCEQAHELPADDAIELLELSS
jgi:hypothetical protein